MDVICFDHLGLRREGVPDPELGFQGNSPLDSDLYQIGSGGNLVQPFISVGVLGCG